MTTEPVPVEGSSDVRMRGFARRHTLTDALNWLDDQLAPLASQAVGLDAAMGRVLDQGLRTADIAYPGTRQVTTAEMGDAILAALDASL